MHSFNYLDHAATAFLVVDADSLEILYANSMATAVLEADVRLGPGSEDPDPS